MSAVPKRPRDDTRTDSRTAQATDAAPLPDVVLQVRGLKVSYGGIQAVKGIDLEVRAGELVTLIGANGAGRDDDAESDHRDAGVERRNQLHGRTDQGTGAVSTVDTRFDDGARGSRRFRTHECH